MKDKISYPENATPLQQLTFEETEKGNSSRTIKPRSEWFS